MKKIKSPVPAAVEASEGVLIQISASQSGGAINVLYCSYMTKKVGRKDALHGDGASFLPSYILRHIAAVKQIYSTSRPWSRDFYVFGSPGVALSILAASGPSLTGSVFLLRGDYFILRGYYAEVQLTFCVFGGSFFGWDGRGKRDLSVDFGFIFCRW